MGKLVILKEYAERTAEERRFEREGYPGLVEKLQPFKLRWEKDQLEIHYHRGNTVGFFEDLFEKNLWAWAFQVFDVVSEIRQGKDIDTVVFFPDKIGHVVEGLPFQIWKRTVIVTWLTKTTADATIEVEDLSLRGKEGQIRYGFGKEGQIRYG